MQKKIAIIDIGSNTIHMDIDEVRGKDIAHLEYKTIVNRLGRCLADSCVTGGRDVIYNVPTEGAVLSNEKLTELINILQGYICYAKGKKVDEIIIFATSILREIGNSNKVIELIKKETGYDIDLISEEREADFALVSAQACFDLKNSNNVIFDMGGGSCEIVYVEKDKVKFKNSYKFGIAKVNKQFNIDVDFTFENEKILLKYFNEILSPIVKNISHVDMLICTSSLLKLLGFIFYKNKKDIYELKNKTISKEQCKYVIKNMDKIDIEDDRRDTIWIGSIFLKVFMNLLKIEAACICPWSIREAYIQLKVID